MKNFLKSFLPCALAFLMLLSLIGCSDSAASYEANEAYQHLFAETDDADTKNLKNLIIEQIEAYNNGDAEGYYKLFNMEREDLNFNVSQFEAMRQNAILTYQVEDLQTAFIDENNAQVLLTMICRCDDRTTGEVLYLYRTDMTYTMVRDGKWAITLQTPGSEEDLMYTLTESETAE